jgi:hypothetical protein
MRVEDLIRPDECDWKQGSSSMNTHPDFEELLRLLEEPAMDEAAEPLSDKVE